MAALEYGHLEVLVNMSQMTVSQMTLTSVGESHQHRLHYLAEHVINWSGVPVVPTSADGVSGQPDIHLACGTVAATAKCVGTAFRNGSNLTDRNQRRGPHGRRSAGRSRHTTSVRFTN